MQEEPSIELNEDMLSLAEAGNNVAVREQNGCLAQLGPCGFRFQNAFAGQVPIKPFGAQSDLRSLRHVVSLPGAAVAMRAGNRKRDRSRSEEASYTPTHASEACREPE